MEGSSFAPESPAAVAAEANAALRRLDEVLWAAKTPDEIVEAVAECEALRSHLAAVEAAALAEVEDRKIAKQQLAWSSTGDWFTHTAGTHRGHGTAAVRHAKLLVAERSADPRRPARRARLPRAGRDHLRRHRGAPHRTRPPGSWPRRP